VRIRETVPHHEPVAIVDIGSNSVRLVVYSGAPRIPSIIFNEKVLAGLGASLAETGRLGAEAQERALAAMRRFQLLIRQMQVRKTRVVATAAARDAENGAEFLDRIRGTRLQARSDFRRNGGHSRRRGSDFRHPRGRRDHRRSRRGQP
jgi:hypothetical protein